MPERQHQFDSQITEISTNSLEESCILFDPEHITLEGSYLDEITAFRAKRGWKEALETYFLLSADRDFSISISQKKATGKFTLTCAFGTACARYAFWRLTNQQAPEAQYVIETAHVPRGASQHEKFLTAPDMRPVAPLHVEGPLVIPQEPRENKKSKKPLAAILEKLLAQINPSQRKK